MKLLHIIKDFFVKPRIVYVVVRTEDHLDMHRQYLKLSDSAGIVNGDVISVHSSNPVGMDHVQFRVVETNIVEVAENVSNYA